MDNFLSKYLGVVPIDYALSRQFNLFDWARNKVAYDNGLIDDPGEPPKYYFDGSEITPQEIKDNIEKAKRFYAECQKTS